MNQYTGDPYSMIRPTTPYSLAAMIQPNQDSPAARAGIVDASGGLIFRLTDNDNYYVVRANSLEGNVVAYKTQDCKRRSIGMN